MNVLLVDDDTTLGNILTMGLKHLGFKVHYLSSFISIIATINEFQPSVIVLDVEIGDKDGIFESEKISQYFKNIPIIFISSHKDIEHINRALEHNGVAYLKKPFPIEELAAYIRRYGENRKSLVAFGNYSLNLVSKELEEINTQQVKQLSDTEFKVMLKLANNINQVVSRSQLTSEVWQGVLTTDQTLNNVISRLRRYISEDATIKIVLHSRVGYELAVNRD